MTDLQETPKAIDWDYIQALYIQGVGPTEIAQRTGVKSDTISVRATRKGWAKLKQRTAGACQSVTVDTETKLDESPKLAAMSERARMALADVLARSAEQLASQPIRNAKHALIVSQDAEPLVRNCKTVMGWGDGASQPAVRINVMGSAVIMPETHDKPTLPPTAPELPELT